MIGSIVGKRYKIGDRLGGGGMAVVYQGRDLQLERDVAVKVLRGQFGSDEDFVRRFRREASNAASLSHPNVVQIYDVGQEDDLYFIVLELIDGRSLKELIQQQGPLPVHEAIRIGLEILSALSHAHLHRIIHRDIKPHNILIARDGRVKVTDFGIARATTTDTVSHTGSIMGSAHYFSPEQADGQVTGEKSDIYSFGVVLYEMVTGTVPFQGESPISVAIKHLRDPVLEPSKLNSEVPIELNQIILKALEKRPEDRYASAGAMANSLRLFAEAHAAGLTHIASGDFPTMDLSSMRTQRLRLEEKDSDQDEEDIVMPPSRQRRLANTKKKKRSYAWAWILAVALVVFGALAAGAIAIINFLDVPDVVVPDVTQKHVREAEQLLVVAGLRHSTLREEFSDRPLNTVIDTVPPPGETVKENRAIGLIISKGPQSFSLQDVRTHSLDVATLMLENQAGFVVVDVRRQTDTAPANTVIEMTPPAGTLLQPGASISLVVSSGPLRVPRVVGKSLEEATELLREANLVLGQVTDRPDPVQPKDRVLASDPAEGAVVGVGQIVTLVVAQGPTATEARAFEKVLTVPGEAGKWYDFRVTLVDQIGGVLAEKPTEISGRYKGEDRVTVKGSFFGELAYLRVFADGIEVARVDLP